MNAFKTGRQEVVLEYQPSVLGIFKVHLLEHATEDLRTVTAKGHLHEGSYECISTLSKEAHKMPS